MSERIFKLFAGRPFRVALERLRNKVLRSKAYGQGQGEHDSTEEDTECEFDNSGRNSEVVQGHSDGEDAVNVSRHDSVEYDAFEIPGITRGAAGAAFTIGAAPAP